MTRRAPVAPTPASPPRISLVQSAPGVDDADLRPLGGLEFDPESCTSGGVFDPCSISAGDLDVADNPDNVEYEPFGVWAGYRCSAIGIRGREGFQDAVARARRALLACESQHIASEFWKGTLAQDVDNSPNRFLASPEANVISTSAQDPIDALAEMEYSLGVCSCGDGVIHAPRNVVTAWAAVNLVTREGDGRLRTTVGTLVIPDTGYDGSDPNGAPATDGSVWVYGTSPVYVRRSPISVPASLDEVINKGNNDVEVRALRYAAVSFDNCCHLAIEVDAPYPADLAGS